MPRIPFVKPDEAPEKVRAVFQELQRARGGIPNIYRVWAHAPESLATWLDFAAALRGGTLDPKLRELASVKVSRINGCHY